MKIVNVLLISELILTYYFNVYKFGLINKGGPLHIFEWMEHGQISHSTKDWLSWHLFLALFLATVTTIFMVYQFDPLFILPLDVLHSMLNFIFICSTGTNIHHFGEYPWYIAITVQSIPLFIMGYTKFKLGPDLWYSKWKWGYYFALFSAPIFEQILYIGLKLL